MFSLVSEIWNFAKLNLETLGHHIWMAYLKTCIVCIMLLCSIVLEWVACPRCSENIKNVEWCIVWILSTYLFWTWLKHQLLATVCSCLAPAAAGQKWNCRLQIVCINNLIVCFFSKHQLVKPVTCPMKLKAVEQMILERNNFDFLQTPYLTEVSYEQVTSTIIIKCCHM